MVGVDAVADEGCRSDAARSYAHRALQGQARRQGRHADPRGTGCLPEVRRPEGRLLAERSGAAFDECVAVGGKEKPGPSAGLQTSAQRCAAVHLVADLDTTEAPAVAIPEALTNPAARRGFFDI